MTAVFDLIVIGAGGAGCAAALTASAEGLSVAMLMRESFKTSKTARAQGGIQAAIGEGDSWHAHFEDTMRAGEHTGNPALARVLAKGAPEAITWLTERGIEFDRNPDGSYRMQTAGGLSYPRILSCGDQSGNRIIGPLLDRVSEADITVLENSAVISIAPHGPSFRLTISDPQGDAAQEYVAHAVVLASGGAPPESDRSGIPGTIDLAKALGLEVKAAALTQFHPTGVMYPKALRGRPAPEGLRAAGADILDKDRVRLADPLLTRKRLCEEIICACDAGRGVETDDGERGVWLDTPKIDASKGAGYTERHYNSFYSAALEAGVDITKDPILVYPIPHYSLGGIVINPDCSTSKPGVFAAGEATWGVHGNDRLMGNSLLEIFVFGKIAGASAAEYLQGRKSRGLAADG